MVRMLLAHGADPNREGFLGYTALHGAAQSGNAAIVRALLAGGANVRHRSRLGGTALHGAAEGIAWPPTPQGITDHHYADVLRALIAAGADLNAKTPQGKTALAIIKRSGRTRYLELLKRAGAKE